LSVPPDPPPKRFPVRRQAILLGVLMGLFYIASGIWPTLTQGRGADGAQIMLGFAILLPSAFMFLRYHHS